MSRFLLVVTLWIWAEKSLAQEVPIYKWASKVLSQTCLLGNNIPPHTKSDGVGNVYILGSFCTPFDADPGTAVFTLTADNSNYDDTYLIKLDPNGNFLWAARFAQFPYGNFASDLTIDGLGNVYALTYYQIGFADYRTIIWKFDAAGNSIWSKTIYTAKGTAQAIVLDASGNPILTGDFSGTVDFDPGAGVQTIAANGTLTDFYVLKLDTAGNFLWVKTAGGTNNERGQSLAIDASNNIILGGYYAGSTDLDPSAGVSSFTSAGSFDAFILKLDAAGNFIWAKSMGGTGNDIPVSIVINTLGNIFLTGYFTGSGDFDPSGSVTTLTSATPSQSDIFLMRLNADGSFGWASGFGGSDDDEGRGLTTDATGNIIFTGFFNGTVDFDPGAGVRNLVSIGLNSYHSMFIAKFDQNQQLIWAQEIAGSSTSRVRAYTISIDAAGDISLGGSVWGGADFDFGVCTKGLSNNPPVGFVMKFKTGITGPPTITSFSPSSGAVGTTVIITGTNFSPVPSENDVRWSPSRPAVVLASTSTTITAIVPSAAITGKIYVTVGCYPLASTATNFVIPAPVLPTISSFTPSTGPVGATVIITGTNFNTIPANNTVKFNGTTAVVTANTATSITTTVPAGATTGKIAVTVGGNTATSTTNFTVTAGTIPTITSFTPTSGPIGTTVTITGTNFSATPSNNTVKFFDGIDSYVISAVVTASTATAITTTVPSGAFTGKIKVTTAGGSVTSASNFTVTCGSVPTITSFSPLSGIAGTTVTITGTNFSTTPSNNAVDFGGITAIVTASTSTSITTSVPTGPVGLVPISVRIACNTVTSSTDFDVTCPPAPTITSFTPGTGAVGAVVTITGTNFSNNPLDNFVDFNGEPAIVTASTTTSITTSVPANAFTGPINVYVGCDVATSSTDFIVDCGPAPTITSFSPSNGLAGTVVTITGANFSTTPANNFVDFNGELAVVTASTATSITTTVPVGAITGPITIVVDCNYVTSTTDFTVGNNITITTQPSDFIACVGQTATFTTAATGTTNIVYQWQFSPDGIVPYTDIANGGGYSNATTATLSVNTTANFGLGRYRCRINGDFAAEVITNDEGLFINPISTAPTVVGANRCGAGSVTLTASGGTNGQYKWYTTPSGGIAIAGETNSSYVTPSITSTTSYYVSLNTNGCESTRTLVTATLTITPAPTAAGVSGCPASAVTLTASGGTNGQYNWYTVSTGGIAIAGATNNTYPISSLTVTSTFYVSLTISGCESTRTAVTATLLSTGCAPVITTQTLSTQVEGKIEINLQSLITTPGTLDPTSIKVITQPASGAVASITNFLLVIDYKGKPFSGKETIIIEACNTNGLCSQQTFTIEVAREVIVFNAVSPNGDGKNEFFVLQYIESLSPKNQVSIYNRWGDEVFSISDYDNKTRVFAGLANGGSKLPAGTYFYKIVLPSGNKTLTGFLSLKY